MARYQVNQGGVTATDLDTGQVVNVSDLKNYRVAGYAPGFSPVEQKPSFLQDAVADIKGIGSGIKERLGVRQDKFQAANQTSNPLRKTFQQVGQGAGFASDVIGETVIGGAKALFPQGVEDKVKTGIQTVGGAIANSGPAQQIAQRYAQIKQTNPTLARDIDAALGIGMLGLDIGTAGATGQVVKQTARGAGKVTGGAANLLARGSGKAADLVVEGQGALVGTGSEALRQAFKAGYAGGKSLEEFTRFIKGQASPEELSNTVRDSAQLLQSQRNKAYSESIGKLGGENVDTRTLVPTFVKNLTQYGITTKGNTLDFSKSKFSTVPAAQSKIQQAYDELVRLGEANNLTQVDTSRQALRNLMLAGEDGSANTANAIINQAIDSVRGAGKQVPGYDKMLTKFSEESEFLEQINKSLSAGDKASVETTFKKLISSLRVNNEQRLELLKQLDEATDGAILSQVAGQQLSEALPRGIIRQILAPIAAFSAVTTGTIFSPQTLIALLGLSPRVAGEFAKTLGITGRKLQGFLDGLEKTRRIIRFLGIDPKNVRAPLPSATVQTVQNQPREQ